MHPNLTTAKKIPWYLTHWYVPCAVVVIVGFFISLFVFISTSNKESHHIRDQFNKHTEGHVRELQRYIDFSLHEIDSIVGLFNASDKVTRDEFRFFIKPYLEENQVLQAIEWVPRVPEKDRATYENEARQEGFPQFRITEKNEKGDVVPADVRSEYFPVYCLEPYVGNEQALGYDLASNPTRLAALNKSRDSGKKVAAIGQLAGSVAHDIRNPLGAISNSIYFLNHVVNEKTDEQIKKHIEIMGRETQRANDIITDLMDFARENTSVMSKGQINNEILSLLDEFTVPEKITVETALDSNLPILLFDPSQIRRVFLNLTTNAFQAMPEGGLLEISSSKSDSFVEIKIQDSGRGIPPEKLENIFEPLFTTKSKGVGLGLSIVKTFVEKHNGTIEVESGEGKGSTFTIKLPVKQEETS